MKIYNNNKITQYQNQKQQQQHQQNSNNSNIFSNTAVFNNHCPIQFVH